MVVVATLFVLICKKQTKKFVPKLVPDLSALNKYLKHKVATALKCTCSLNLKACKDLGKLKSSETDVIFPHFTSFSFGGCTDCIE